MSRIARTRASLLKTSAATDVKRSGDSILITGLGSISRKSISRIVQFKSRAEVVQVYAAGGGSYTPTADTEYIVIIDDIYSRKEGSMIANERQYKYKTPTTLTDIGATAALQREAIHVALVAKINADSSNNVAALTLGTGTGFSITDDAGYFPAKVSGGQNPRGGANNIRLPKDSYGRGFVQSTALSLTTAAVYSFGIGTRMAQDTPVIAAVYAGNIIAGEVDAPLSTDGTGAVAGQKYDAFYIESLVQSEVPTIGEVIGYRVSRQIVYVDNGTGSSVTNLAGSKAFERQMHKIIANFYQNDPSATIEFFDKPIVFQDPLGAAPTGTANTLGWQVSPYSSLNRTNIGTQTIVAPVLNATGLLLDQDDNSGDGSHTSANQQTIGAGSFIVGTDAFSVTARVVMGDWTDSQFLLGFRKKAVYAADYNDYTDLGAIGGGAADGDSVTTQGILNNAATVATDSTINFADAVSVLLTVKVAVNGTVTAYVDGVSCPIYSAGTTALVFDAGDEMIPFYQHVNIGSGDPAVSIGEFFAVAEKDWLVTE